MYLSLSLSSQPDEIEEISVGIKMQVFDRMTIPIRRVWSGVATRFGVRKSAHMKLRKDISSCEYEDVRVMWEMLSRNEAETIRSPTTSKGRCRKRPLWNCFEWAKRAPFFCRSFWITVRECVLLPLRVFSLSSYLRPLFGYHRSSDNKRKKNRERMEGFVCEIAPLLPFGVFFSVMYVSVICRYQPSVMSMLLSLVLCNKLLYICPCSPPGSLILRVVHWWSL